MLRKGNQRCLALAVLAAAGLTFAGCSTTAESKRHAPLPGDKDYGKALLYVDSPFLGANRLYAYPDPIQIGDYTAKPGQTVTWYFIHKSTKIIFEEPKIGDNVPCKEEMGMQKCTLTLPTGLKGPNGKRRLKYTIKGADGQGNLHDHDPEVEIDR